MKVDEYIGRTASKIVSSSDAHVLLITKKTDAENLFNFTIFKEGKTEISRTTYTLNAPDLPSGILSQIRMLILKAVEKNILAKDDYVFCIADKSLGKQFEGLFVLLRVDDDLLALSKKKAEQEARKTVFEAVLNIAREIGREGREGRKIGTAFIVGDAESVMKKSTQLILNPFEGHMKQNIMNIELKETLKEFSQLDGVFVVDDDGTVMSAGRYLSVDTSNVKLPGLGARHLSAAAISKQTKATAIVVSESGGIIRVFRDGKLAMEEVPS